jgi:hypothetical protein
MKIYYLLILFITGIFIVSAEAQWEGMKMTKNEFKEMIQKSFKETEMKRNWQLYGKDNKNDLDFYYDEKNIQRINAEEVGVLIKTFYKSKKGIDQLKRMRKINVKDSQIGNKDLQYDGLAYTIETLNIHCDRKEYSLSELSFDFDKESNILNLIPNITQALSIRPGSTLNDLYKIVCSHGGT